MGGTGEWESVDGAVVDALGGVVAEDGDRGAVEEAVMGMVLVAAVA